MNKLIFLSLLFIAIQGYGQKMELIPTFNSEIIIDGQRENIWDSTGIFEIDKPYGGSYSNVNDFSGNWTALWDVQNIYFFFTIHDDSLYNLGANADKFWIHDCVEIFIDLLNNKDSVSTDDNPVDDNYQYRFIWNLDDEPIFENPPVAGMENISYTVVENSITIGYTVEIKIPWTTLIQRHNFGSVVAGRKIGIEIKINDLDSPYVPTGVWAADAELLWNNDTKQNLKISSSFGTIQLVNTLFNDSLPAASIHDLEGIVTGSSSASISWTSPADENTGSAAFYDIRYSQDSVELVNWTEATVIANNLVPEFPGSPENTTFENLPAGTILYFAIKTIDNFNNASEISNIIKLKTLDPDIIIPATITDLKVDSITSFAVELSWTAQGDDNTTGVASGYEIRYSETNLSEENWENAIQISNAPVPLIAGTNQNVLIHSLSPEKTYYFGIKVFDEAPNYSELSNVVQVTTPKFIYINLLSMDQLIGTNSFIDVPNDKLEAVSFVREYHPWSFTEIADDVFEYNRWNGFWDFDKYYTSLKGMGITVCPVLWSSPDWLESNSSNKPVGNGENAEDPNSYLEMAQFMYQYAARYGSTEVNLDKLLVNSGQIKKTGMDVIKYFEDWNEQDRDWEGRDAMFLPEEYAAMASANVDGNAGQMGDGYGIKTADPNAKFVMGGLYKIGTEYISKMRDWFIANRADGKWPIDVINMHHYAYSYELNGISPEQDDYKSKVTEVTEWRNEYAPENEVWITEFGYDTNDDSPNRINEFGGFDQQEIQAQWIVRTFLILSSVGVDRAAQFMLRDVDGSGEPRWRDCGLTLSSIEGYTPKISWYYVSTLKNVMKDMVFDAVVSETNTAWVYRYKNEKLKKYVYALWSPTSNGSESEYRLKIVQNPTYIYQVEMEENSTSGIRTNLNYSTDQITISISEKPLFFVAGYGEPDGVSENSINSTNHNFIYPNPCFNKVTILIPQQIDKEKMQVKVYSIDGKEVQITMDQNKPTELYNIEFIATNPGIYIIQLFDDKSIFTNRIIKY